MTLADIPAADLILQAAHQIEFSFAPQLARNLSLSPQHWWLLEHKAQLVGVVGATDYEAFAHIGLMAIHPSHQVSGSGSNLLTHLLGTLPHRSITLYSTDAGLAFYPRHGFTWAGVSTEWHLRKRHQHTPTYRVAPSTDFDQLARFDAPIFIGNRRPLLERLEQESPGRILTATDENGEIQGFLAAQSVILGPFAATSRVAAADLLHAALQLDFAATPRVLLPDAHPEAESLMIEAGFAPFRTSRYFTLGEVVPQQRRLMYGQAAYSLG
jgi:N-acetylglutamate synthase-like GNAT family acetyltransferase